jgi:hypothetical protein
MQKNYWQPNIDNWIVKKNYASGMPAMNFNSTFSIDKMANNVAVKNEEEENDALEHSYKGIITLKKLRQEIHKILEDVYGLSKTEQDAQNAGNPYDKIIQVLENPDLKAMLDIASNEIKKRNLSSF